MIFRDLLKYVDFLPDSFAIGPDGKQFLAREFTFVLNKAGKKHSPAGRRSFPEEVGKEVQFGFSLRE